MCIVVNLSVRDVFVNIFLALSVVPTYVWIFNSQAFEHYAISYLPLIMISLVEIRKLIDFRGLYIAIPVVVILLVVLYIRLFHYYKPNAEPMGLTQKSIEMTDNVPKCDTLWHMIFPQHSTFMQAVSQITDFSLCRIGL